VLKRLRYIADIARKALGAGADDITTFFSPSKFKLCWSNLYFYFEEFLAVGFITETEKDMIVSGAARSDCGKKYE
jgi:hypothetical protein